MVGPSHYCATRSPDDADRVVSPSAVIASSKEEDK
jgi:hypothetical protein